MFVFSILLASQAVSEPNTQQAVSAPTSPAIGVAGQAIECMEKQTKIQLRAQMSNANPERIVASALEACSYLKRTYAQAVSSSGSNISASTGRDLADKWFLELRSAFVSAIDAKLAKPDFAEPRLNLMLMQWRNCVTDRAKNWSRLTDSAETIAQAALTSCHSSRLNVVEALSYRLRSQSLQITDTQGIVANLQTTMKEVAVETIIAERAKRLPQKR